MQALVAHYHEIGLKGRNRDFFEQALVRNLRLALRGTGYSKVRSVYGRAIVDFGEVADVAAASERATRVFGVAYVGAGVKVDLDMGSIGDAALKLMTAEPFGSFSVRARRSYSSFKPTSQQINETVGQLIKDSTGARVDLSNPEATAHIELYGNEGLVFRHKLRGPGGLPVGVSGKMLALLSGGIDSPVAAWRMARRGAEVELVHFHGQPYTDPSSARQAADLATALTKYQLKATLHLVPLGDAQREIVVHAPSSLRVILYRRMMLRIAATLGRDRGTKALVMGDSLGQVASQTIENLTAVDAAVPDTQVLRPLIGMDKQEIVDLASQIGTYEISTRKHQDCCVLFEARAPATKARIVDAEKAEAEIDVERLIGNALEGLETTHFELPALGTRS